MSDLPSFPKLSSSFQGFSFKFPKKDDSIASESGSPIKTAVSTPSKLTNPFHHNTTADISLINYDDISQKIEDDIKFGQIPDIVDYVRWLSVDSRRTSEKMLFTGGNSTRSLNLVLFDGDGIQNSRSYSKPCHTKVLDSMDFASKISSLS